MLRIIGVLSLPAMGLIACSTAPSTANPDFSDNGRLIGELEVYGRFIIVGDPDAVPEESTLWPGRFAARVARLERDRIVLDIDAPAVGDLAVELREGAGEFPVNGGGFSFLASQHDLPYTIHGEHGVNRSVESTRRSRESCPIDVLRESCYTTEDGESCSVSIVTVNGWQSTEETVISRSEDLALTFVDAQAAVVVARYYAASEPSITRRSTPVSDCQN